MQVRFSKKVVFILHIFLITTGTICFIEALRNPVAQIRHIMNLETCISVVAGYFYGVFVDKLNKAEKEAQEAKENNANNNEENKELELPYEKINDMRYTDWAISTPLMLLVLCMVLGMENKKVVSFMPFVLILLFNFLMLGSGYVGELGKLPTTLANIIGFVFFTLMYGTVWKVYMTGSRVTKQSQVIYWLFVLLWALYGVFYQTPTLTKIFGYNILDLLSKAFVGIFFWFYLTKSIRF